MMEEERITPGTALVAWIATIMVAMTFAILLVAVLAFPVMMLWNSVMTDLFELKRINYIRSFELLLLARIFLAPSVKYQKKK